MAMENSSATHWSGRAQTPHQLLNSSLKDGIVMVRPHVSEDNFSADVDIKTDDNYSAVSSPVAMQLSSRSSCGERSSDSNCSALTSNHFNSTGAVKRDRWSSRGAFILAAIASAVGIGNLWRFPYLCYKYGGGAFFIPYFLALFVVGIPILQLEFSLGQFFQGGHGVVFNSLSKRARGLGLAAPFACFCVVIYYSAILGWSLVYMVYSFFPNLPWTVAADEAKLCPEVTDWTLCNQMETCAWSSVQELCQPSVLKRAESFFNRTLNVADPNSTISIKGSLYILIGLCVTWMCVFLAIFKGAKILGRVIYVTMALPIILLIIITVRAASLPGASAGIEKYILNWDTSVLVNDPSVWSAAVGQIFFSIGVCWGVMTAYASFNRKQQNVVQDALIVGVSNSAFSVVAGFAVFAVAGYLASESNTDLADLENAGVGLAFWTFPTALAQLGSPSSQLFSVLFFLMFYLLGIDSAFSMVESCVTFALDTNALRSTKPIKIIFVACMLGFLAGIPFCSTIGVHLLDVVDHYLSNVAAIFLGFCECVAAGWLQGTCIQSAYVGFPSVVLLAISYLGGGFLGTAIAYSVRTPASWAFGLPAGAILGPVFGSAFCLLGMVLAVVLASKKTGEPLTLSGRIWWLYLGNIETLRRELNAVVAAERKLCCCTCPGVFSTLGVTWSILIKFIIPLVLLLLLGETFSNGTFGSYGGFPAKYQVAGISLALLPMVFVLLGVALPFLFRPCLASEDGNNTKMAGTWSPSLVTASRDSSDETELADAEEGPANNPFLSSQGPLKLASECERVTKNFGNCSSSADGDESVTKV